MTVAVVGASGAVGQEIIRILAERNFKIDKLYLFGSERSAGCKYQFGEKEIEVRLLQHKDVLFKDIDIFFTSVGADIAKEYKEDFIGGGAYLIDNSSAFRLDPTVPLVIPEINKNDLLSDCYKNSKVIANPNCSTIMMALPLYAIHKLSPIKRIRVATYQAASGVGYQGMQELEQQYIQIAHNETTTVSNFPYQLAYNVFPHVDEFLSDGYSGEEYKMSVETQKIFHATMGISATCVRVPVMRCHSESVWVETESKLDLGVVREAISEMPGCVLQDDVTHNLYPMPIMVSNKDDIYVGRLRKDFTVDNGIVFWCVGDQLRKGAALNAVQIAESLM